MGSTTGMALPPQISGWLGGLGAEALSAYAPASSTAIFCADMTIGFCRKGPLASSAIDALTEPVVQLFRRAHAYGVREFVLVQDAHRSDATEFDAFPPHCIRGTEEAETIPELRSLPFAAGFTLIEKDSLHPSIATKLDAWLEEHADLRHAIVVGNCTDLCVYQLAMYLRLRANAIGGSEVDVVVPAACVATYDTPEGSAPPGVFAHGADFFHAVFLYHLALNGVRIVKEIVETP